LGLPPPEARGAGWSKRAVRAPFVCGQQCLPCKGSPARLNERNRQFYEILVMSI